MRFRALRGLGVALLYASLAGAAHAADGEPVRAGSPNARAERPLRVILISDIGAEWRERAWGQLSDLPIELGSEEIDASTLTAPALPRLAELHDADVVAWLTSAQPRDGRAEDTSVVIYEASAGRFHSRTLGAAWSELGGEERSAALETGALTLRSVLRAMLEEAEPPTAVQAAEAAREWELRAAAGAAWQLDGQTENGALSLGAEIGVSWRLWSFSLAGQWGLDSEIPAREAKLRVARRSAFLEARHYSPGAASLQLGLLVRGGLSVTERASVAASDSIVPLPASKQSSVLLGAGVVGRWRPARQHALELTLAANGHSVSPRYVVRVLETGGERAYLPWKLQPAAGLAWAFAF